MGNSALTYPVLESELRLGGTCTVLVKNQPCGFWIQDSLRVGISRHRPCFSSAFLPHISNVVLMGSKKKMGRVAARRIVAVVADVQPVWNRAVMNLIRDAVGLYGIRLLGVLAEVKTAIAMSIRGASPSPACQRSVRHGDVRVKALLHIHAGLARGHAVSAVELIVRSANAVLRIAKRARASGDGTLKMRHGLALLAPFPRTVTRRGGFVMPIFYHGCGDFR
jgi:hypothetical protein